MTSQELKNNFFQYFQSKDHTLISSASLIPENDPTVLFTTAGMHPLVPYLMGEKHPAGLRLVNVQKCLRTGDIDEVGDATHHTFFEMLGNWSLGDYFKKEAIEFSWEFLTEILKLDKNKLAVSVFAGDDDVSRDEESSQIWQSIGVSKIAYLGKKDNWWGPAGQTGPCGPDTEIFYWTSSESVPDNFDPEDKRWVEIWNNVLMQYNKTINGQYEPLNQKNIDTGMGLERTLAVLNGLDDNYLTELWQPIIKQLEKLSAKKYGDDKKSFRIVADHIRSAVFLMGDPRGIAPANKDQGYVLRRLIRRAIRFAKLLGIEQDFCVSLAQVIIDLYKIDYPELETNQKFIIDELAKEENKFSQTIEKGIKELEKLVDKNLLNEKEAFQLFATYGFPLEMTLELAKEKGLNLSESKYQTEFKQHQDLSRTASAGMFKGGLADDSEMATKYHTATHLLHQALRNVLGNHVEQRGSNINAERLRFDFVHPDPMTAEQIKKVEDIVNQQIQLALAVTCDEMSVAEAKEQGAIGLFDKKYGEKIKVYTVGPNSSTSSEPPFSREICGGPHVKNTNELGKFSIKKEQSSSAGIRRIKAVLE
ncbi:MAG: alanine--tRNA ligase [Patescibacteria group bacterium]